MAGQNNYMYGTHRTDETKKRISETRIAKGIAKGDRNPAWIDGRSYIPYTEEFNSQLKELVRNRDGYRCQLCGIPENEYFRKLDVHHIDYDKTNCLPNNLITLRSRCNVKVNKNRSWWINIFHKLNEDKN